MSEKMIFAHSEMFTYIVHAKFVVENKQTGEVSVGRTDFEIEEDKVSEDDFDRDSVGHIESLECAEMYKSMISSIVERYGFNLCQVIRLDFERFYHSYVLSIE